MNKSRVWRASRVIAFTLTLALLSALSLPLKAQAATPNFGYFGYSWSTDEILEFELSPPLVSDPIKEYQIFAQYSQSQCFTGGGSFQCASYSGPELLKTISPSSTTGRGDITINNNSTGSRTYKNVQKFSLRASELRTYLSNRTTGTNRGLVLMMRAVYGNSITEWSDANFVDPRKLWGSSYRTDEQSEQNVTIAYQGPLTGPEAEVGIAQVQAVKYAIAKFNKAYTGKYRVTLVEVDDQGDPTVAPRVAPGIAANGNILGVVGPAYSGATIASLASYKPAGLPMISPSASRISLTDPSTPGGATGSPVFHRITATEKAMGPAVYQLAIEGVASPKAFIIDDQSPYGIGLLNYLKAGVKEGVIVGFDSVSSQTTNWAPTIAKLRASNANVVIYLGYYPQTALLVQQLRESGYVGVLASSDGSFSPELTRLVSQSTLEGFRALSATAPLADISNELESDFVATIGKSSNIFAAESIDAANVFLSCISKGINSRNAMLTCVKSFRGESVYGDQFGFDSNGDNTALRTISYVVRRGAFTLFNTIAKDRSSNSTWWPWYPTSAASDNNSGGSGSGSNSSGTTVTPAKPIAPKFSSVSFTGNTVNIAVNIGTSTQSPDKVYLVAPKLGITANNPLAGKVSGSSATWSIEFDKLLGGTAIPLEVVSERDGVRSESTTNNYLFPSFTPELTSAPPAPKNFKTRIVGNSVVITAEAEINSSSLATKAHLFSQSLGIPKSRAMEGDVVGTKILFELPLKAAMAGKRYPIMIYLSNSKGDSQPLEGTLTIPAAPRPQKQTTAPKPTAPKTVICTRSSQTRTFTGTKCPPGWVKN